MDSFNTFYNGISGVNAMSQQLDVTANNIANANTSAFKTGRATFVDTLETFQGTEGVGHGVRLGSIGSSFDPGAMESTSRSTDMAISGAGFFQLRASDSSTAGLYTRDGNFKLIPHQGPEPDAYNLVTTSGQFVQGYDLSATTVPATAVSDIMVKSITPQTATSQVDVVVNLDSGRGLVETTNAPLYSAWDGSNAKAPISDNTYDYKTSLKIYGPDASGVGGLSNSDYLTVYFDGTSNPGDKEFLVTCDPAADQRLIGGTTHYSTADKGAGALLYGVLHFTANGELGNVECWRVPQDGNLTPTAANQLQLGRGESYFSFDYNFNGAATNSSAILNFGTSPTPQAVASRGQAFTDNKATSTVASTSTWDSIFDAQGHQAKAGDVITVRGTSGDGSPQTYAYTVDPSQSLSTMLSGLEAQFGCTATVVGGKLTLTDNTVGTSQLGVSAITYRSAAGATPATDPSLAQVFGADGTGFVVDQEQRYSTSPLATTSYASPSATIYQSQNGFGRGTLDSISVDNAGQIIGNYSNGQKIPQAKLVLANFNNLQGLRAEGGTTYSATAESGGPLLGTVGQAGLGTVRDNALEMSNVDLGRELAGLIVTQRAFQANSKAITSADQIYEDLLQLIRR